MICCAWLGPVGADVLLSSWVRTGALSRHDAGALMLANQGWASEVGRVSHALLQGHLDGPDCPMSSVSWVRALGALHARAPAGTENCPVSKSLTSQPSLTVELVTRARGVRLGALEAAVTALQEAGTRGWGAPHRRNLEARLHPRALWRRHNEDLDGESALASFQLLCFALDPIHLLYHVGCLKGGARTDLRLWAWHTQLQWLNRMFAYGAARTELHPETGGLQREMLLDRIREMRRVRWEDANVRMHVRVGQLASLVLTRAMRHPPP